MESAHTVSETMCMRDMESARDHSQCAVKYAHTFPTENRSGRRRTKKRLQHAASRRRTAGVSFSGCVFAV
eukprot:6176765-Pleurochrysis_carterae.AAC.1